MIAKPFLFCMFAGGLFSVLGSAARADNEWPQFRGPEGQGRSDARGLPVTWSESNNVIWKTALPGYGHSSPVISGNRIWLTASPDKGKTRHVLRVALDSGKIERDIKLFDCEKPEICHTLNSYATPTPVLEADRVYVTFGTPGTACLDAQTGRVLWERRDFVIDYRDVGAASSPILYRDSLILTCDGQTGSKQYVVALDKNTGKTLWKTDRTFPPGKPQTHIHSSAVPLVIRTGNRDQLISPAAHGVHAYDPATGTELWQAWYDGWSVVPRPVFADGRLVVCAGTTEPTLLCLRPEGAVGTLTESAGILWKTKTNVPDMPSPLMVGNRLFTMTATTLSCIDPADGRVLWAEKLPGQYLSSPVEADGKLFIFSRGKTSAVVELGDTFHIVATNRLEDGCMASPAIVGHSLIVRTTKALYRIGSK